MDNNKEYLCKAIIFDCDGVLVDSSADVERHWREWAERHGLDMGVIGAIMHGRRAVETMEMVAPHLDIPTEAARFAEIEAVETEGLVPIKGAKSLLESLPPEQWGVATSGTRAIALARLAAGGLPVPRVLVTADDVARGKPAPDAYLMAAEKLGFKPEDCVVFEDAPAGVKAAVSAGMRVFGLFTSHGVDELWEAEMVIEDLSMVKVIEVSDGRLRVVIGEFG
jgi:sugar-phosphatase